jgi:hypothetical protein
MPLFKFKNLLIQILFQQPKFINIFHILFFNLAQKIFGAHSIILFKIARYSFITRPSWPLGPSGPQPCGPTPAQPGTFSFLKVGKAVATATSSSAWRCHSVGLRPFPFIMATRTDNRLSISSPQTDGLNAL